MSRRQAKRAAFAHSVRVQRVIDRLHRQNRHTPGYLGVAQGFRLTAPNGQTVYLGTGVISMRNAQ